MRMEDTYEQPFPEAALTEEDFKPIKSLVGSDLEIVDVETFENDKGPGVYILYRLRGETKLCYTTTHSINITKILSGERIREGLDRGDVLECRLVERPSRRDGSKTVLTLI